MRISFPLAFNAWVSVVLACLLVACQDSRNTRPDAVVLVQAGMARSVVVMADKADAGVRAAGEQFVRLVERSTGAKIPILPEAAKLPPDTARISLGATRLASEAGLTMDGIPEEGYRMLTKGNTLFILGREPSTSDAGRVSSRPTRWALNAILEEQLGVRWLWPGELGTHVPKRDRLAIPEMDVTHQPALSVRNFWVPKALVTAAKTPEQRRIGREAFDWAENHQGGSRDTHAMGHSFQDWWAKHGKNHPDYFAETPPGFQQPWPRAERVKLRLSNPAVIEQIARDYQAAGAPDYWNLTPNDGSGFDVGEASRAWDIPQNQNPAAMWQVVPFQAQPDLTARYVEFWNRLHERLRQINPNVTLGCLAYSLYRNPPPAERPLKAKMIIGLVPTFFDYEQWKGWRAAGVEKLYLRPNWWHRGADAPYLPLHETADFFHFAWKNGLAGVIMDYLVGYWGTQGPNYYLAARLMSRPDLSADEILSEYTSAFGRGAPRIREYLAYWEKLSPDYEQMGAQKGELGALIKADKVQADSNVFRQAMPHLYPDDVLAPAGKLLDEARQLIGTTDPEALARVEFLQNGLEEARAFRDTMAAYDAAKKGVGTREEFDRQYRRLMDLRRKLAPDHGIWSDIVGADEARRQTFGDFVR